MSRLRKRLVQLREQNKKALGLFLTNGFPEPEATLPLLHTIDEAGADFIELGMPFSDPLAEGLPIQRSSARALQHGITLKDTLETAAEFTADSNTPLVLMGYINPVYHYGVEAFCRDAKAAGVAGLILPDVPVEEAGQLEKAAAAEELALTYLIAPNTPEERIRTIDQKATGFVYAVSITGLTGGALGGVDSVGAYLQKARGLVQKNPLLVGFGIRTHGDVLRLSEHTDGTIVGSALINEVERLWDEGSRSEAERLAAVRAWVHALKTGQTAP